MQSGQSATAVDAVALLAAAAGALADDGAAALPQVLEDVRSAFGLRSAVLRDAGSGALRSVVGETVHAVPPHRSATGPSAVVELPVHGDGVRLATLTVVGARPSQLPVLRAVCALVGLALSSASRALPVALLAAADADADDAADALHDGAVQELVYARLAADAAARGGDAVGAREAVHGALQSLRRTLWLMRPRGTTDGGLAGVLPQLSDRLVDSGHPGLALDVDPAASEALPTAAAAVLYRLVQAYARTAREQAPAARLVRTDDTVRLVLSGAGPLPAPDRWTARARALGAVLELDLAGGALLSVPAVPRTDPMEIEAIP